jgi:crotonobetainyl-CoA:carnitine CoA-transferase CaiB-like acyl-CoA transferase
MPLHRMNDNTPATPAGPLQGLRVVEMGQLIAGPFAGKTLADFGAEVIKIEPPGSGDPLRGWRLLKDGTRCGGRCSRATSARSRSTCAPPKARTSRAS